jgi:hypothetical protein
MSVPVHSGAALINRPLTRAKPEYISGVRCPQDVRTAQFFSRKAGTISLVGNCTGDRPPSPSPARGRPSRGATDGENVSCASSALAPDSCRDREPQGESAKSQYDFSPDGLSAAKRGAAAPDFAALNPGCGCAWVDDVTSDVKVTGFERRGWRGAKTGERKATCAGGFRRISRSRASCAALRCARRTRPD